jgi:hypothetical protein
MNPPSDTVLQTIRHYILRGDDLQATRRHVVNHHGKAEWSWLSTTETQSHGRERASVARWLWDIRKLSRHNGYTPRRIVRLARQAAN